MSVSLKQHIDEMVSDLIEQLKSGIGGEIEGAALVGSYAAGSMSLAKPDVNLFLCLNKKAGADTYIKLGELTTSIARKYSKHFSLRPEFRPFRFPYPFTGNGQEVTLNIILASITEKELDFPFGLPKHFLEGLKSSQKLVIGRDVLANLDLEFDRRHFMQAAFRDLGIFKMQLVRVPMTYDLERDHQLVFGEALTLGKMLMYLGVELALGDAELRDKRQLDLINNKEKMTSFYSEKYGEQAAEAVATILDARSRFAEWKSSRQRALEVFRAAYQLCEITQARLFGLAGKQ